MVRAVHAPAGNQPHSEWELLTAALCPRSGGFALRVPDQSPESAADATGLEIGDRAVEHTGNRRTELLVDLFWTKCTDYNVLKFQ